jgi:hypothetical protein
MSVVLVTPDYYQTVARTISALRAQSHAEQLELVLVAPDLKLVDLPAKEQRGFGAVRFVQIGDVKRFAAAQAAGVRAATAEVVVFAEDHAFPQPGWADALIAAHRGPWTVVGPAVLNANPESVTSWADFLLGYGRWRVPVAAGSTGHVPGHNSSYKRDALLSYGSDLTEWLQAPALLHADLAARGLQLYLEPAAMVSHTNFSSTRVWLRTRFHAGRAFAAARARRWTMARRVMHAMATPLVPFVRVARIFHESRRQDQPAGFFLRIAPLLWFGLALDAFGEFIGYLGKAPDNYEREWDWEFRRETPV